MKMKNYIYILLVSTLLVGACKKETKEIGMPASKMEGIMADWQMSKAIQVDETSLTKESANIFAYFSKSMKLPNIKFTATTYTVDTVGLGFNLFGGASGTWAFDDVLYPSKITFTPDGGEAFDLKLNGPIRPQDNLKLSKEIYNSCKGKDTWVMSYNVEFIRK
jgi:hypothetical protein